MTEPEMGTKLNSNLEVYPANVLGGLAGSCLLCVIAIATLPNYVVVV